VADKKKKTGGETKQEKQKEKMRQRKYRGRTRANKKSGDGAKFWELFIDNSTSAGGKNFILTNSVQIGVEQ